MNQKTVKLFGIIALLTFIVGMIYGVCCIVGGVFFLNVSDASYDAYMNAMPEMEFILAIFGVLGGSLLGTILIAFGIAMSLGDVIAHVPALIGYIVGKKGNNKVLYWIMIALWLTIVIAIAIALLFGGL